MAVTSTTPRGARLQDERRLVTVLFADLSGSTELGRSTDPEAMRAILGRFFDVARAAIEARGGRVEKYIGDAVMAVFGMPRTHEDDPVRAVDAALEVRDRVRADPLLGERVPVHLGVATGEVIATRESAAGDFLVTGDAVNTAARLQQRARPWEILVASRTVEATGERFRWGRPRRPRIGSERVSARTVAGRVPRTVGRRMPLVDREADLRQLELIAARCFVERRPHLVTVIAPAGTGKTRLLEEFLERTLPGVHPDVQVASAQCLPYGDQLTYGPMRDLLLSLAGVSEPAPPGGLRAGVEAWLAATGATRIPELADALLATAGQGDGSPADRASVLAAWRTALAAAAASRPLVLVVEDLHWASDTVLDLLEFGLAPHGTQPILGLVLARPHLLDRRPNWGGGRRNSLVLSLPPLPDTSVAELVDLHLGRHVPAVVERVQRRADGNPFFVGELVRAIRDQAAADDETAVESVLGRLPDSIQATVLSRIDLLGPAARRTLQLASVFGRRFSTDAIQALDAGLGGDLRYAIDALEDHEIVVAEPDGEFAFRHMLFRDVAYQTLTRTDRSVLHGAAAAWIEAGAARREDEVAEIVAYHRHEALDQARAAGLPEDEEQRQAATAWLRRAALVDLRSAAGPEAARHLIQALETASPDQLPELYELLGDARVIGEEAAAAYARAQQHAGSGASADDRLRLIGKRIAVETRWQGAVAHRRTEAELYGLVAEGESLLPEATDEVAIAAFLVACGFLPYWRVGGGLPTTGAETDRRRAGTERGLAMARAIGDAALESAALDALSGVAQSLGRHAEAWGFARQRLELGGRLPLGERLDACAFCGWEASLLGEFEEVARVTERAVELMEPFSGLVAAVHAMAWRAHALAMLGDWDAALAAAEAAEHSWNETGRGAAAYAAQGFLAALEICRSRDDEAGGSSWQEVLEESCAPFEQASFARAALHVARLDREALLGCVAHPTALVERPHFVERALATCLDRGWLPDEAPLRAILDEAIRQGLRPLEAQVRRGIGLVTGSASELRTALGLCEAMSAGPMVGRLQVELGAVLGDAQLVDGGAAVLLRIGDRQYVRSHVPA
jgi:class 3 adenylate cyclase